jgi:hypothetical protein
MPLLSAREDEEREWGSGGEREREREVWGGSLASF